MKSRVIFVVVVGLFFSTGIFLNASASDNLTGESLYENFNFLCSGISDFVNYILDQELKLEKIKVENSNEACADKRKKLYKRLSSMQQNISYLEKQKDFLNNFLHKYNSSKENLKQAEKNYRDVNSVLNKAEFESKKKLFDQIKNELEITKEAIAKEDKEIIITLEAIKQFKEDFNFEFFEFNKLIQQHRSNNIQIVIEKEKFDQKEKAQKELCSNFKQRHDKELIVQLLSKINDLEIPGKFDLPKKSKKDRIKIMQDLNGLSKFYDEVYEGIEKEEITITDHEEYIKIFDFIYKESLKIYDNLEIQKIDLKKHDVRELSDKIHIFPNNFDFINKSVSEAYVDLVVFGLIEYSINHTAQGGDLSDAQKLKYFLKHSNLSIKQKRLIERYVWEQRKERPDLLGVIIAEKNFTKQSGQELLDSIVEMIKQVKDLEDQGDFSKAKKYKVKKELDYKLLYFIDEQKNKILDSRDFGLRFVFEENEKQKFISECELKNFLIKRYQITKDEVYLLFSYAKKFEDGLRVAPKDLRNAGLELQTTDEYLKNIIDVCIHLDTIINDDTITLSEKVKRYGNFIKNDNGSFCQYLRECLESNDTQARNNFIFDNKECHCFEKEHCRHKNTYSFIFSCITNYVSLHKSENIILYRNLTAVLGGNRDTNFIKKEDKRAIFQNIDASTKASMEMFEKMTKQHSLNSNFEKIALYNIIKHRPDLIPSNNDMSFKAVAKHLLIPCFAKVIQSGTCDVSLLKETLIKTRLVMTNREISMVLSATNQIINKEETSEEIKDVLTEYNAQIIALKKKNIKKFDIWNTSSSDLIKIMNKTAVSGVTDEEKAKLTRINFLLDQGLDFTSSVKKVFFEDVDCDDELLKELNEFVENDSSEDQIEKNRKYHAAERRKKIKEAKDEILFPLKGFSQQWALQKMMQKYQGDDLPPELQAQQIKEFEQYDEHNKSVHDMFYENYCQNEDLIGLHYQEKDKKLKNEYEVTQVAKIFNTSFQGRKLW